MGYHEDLAEAPSQALQGQQHARPALFVQRSENLVEDEQADRAPGLEPHVLTDGHPQGQIGQVHLGTGEAAQVVEIPPSQMRKP